jgi:hypothetical protein
MRDPFDPYVEAGERIIATGTGHEIGRPFAKVEFAVTATALLVRQKATVLRLPEQQIRVVEMLDGTLGLELTDPQGAVLQWTVVEPTDWVTTLRALVG